MKCWTAKTRALVVVPLLWALTGCGGGNRPPTVSIATPEDNQIFRELEVNFTAVAEDPEGEALRYDWDFGDGQNGSDPSLAHSYLKGGAYTVTLTVTDAAQQRAQASVNVRVNDPPKVVAAIQGEQAADVVVKFISGEAPLAVAFDASKTTDSDGSIFSYQWDFGDGKGADGASPAHTFEAPGDYTVAVVVTDNMGAQVRDSSITVSVVPATSPPAMDENGVHLIHMVSEGDSHRFEPAFLRIRPGETVRWIDDSGVHATASYSPENQRSLGTPQGATGWDSGLLTYPGDSFEVTFSEPGTYAYFCQPHEAQGMVGVIVVGQDAPELSPDFLNGLRYATVRDELAKQVGIGTGGVVHTIQANDRFTFEPAVVKVHPGDTIRWVNTGQFPHTVTSYHPDYYGKALGIPQNALGWDSDTLAQGGTWSLTIPQNAPPGTYAYFCVPHEALGMVGLIVVEDYTPLSEAFISSLTAETQQAFKAQMEEALKLE